MAELQKSLASFRRQGSSGLVWDDKFLSGLNQNQLEEQQQQQQSTTAGSTLERSRSAGARVPYRSVNVAPPTRDPPSPKVATCGFCGLFGKPVAAANTHNPKSRKRR
ncbi:hypothetical protein L195_g010203 [Trifolium pratense]|uniref:MAPK kinase substrate protein n=1 Tax=Trifolium pratense TaxID=57577 RepID=A0A2K3PE20_TRIPR|nr:uncharacterized protein At1g15400 [Trifolium pratense]PNY13547.1 hypothetical protein L195_g010203 [Trifolium pratense]